nr:dienelactone hydrolase family protein [Corynebacterium sp. TAE3-ERU30]
MNTVAENLKKHLSKLSKRGPHRVLVGDLSYAGIPGKVYTPAEGQGLPAVAFGHDWRQGIKHYHATLRHLASWGIVAVAPDTETGFAPDHRGFAADLETCMQIAAGVKLGQGNITVAPGKIGLVGHGMGAGAAILAAVDRDLVKAVAAIYPSVTAPSSEEAARHVNVPGLVLSPGRGEFLDMGNPPKVAFNWGGDVAFRVVDKASQTGFREASVSKLLTGISGLEFGAQETARGLVTGFLLHQLAGENKYSAFSAFAAEGKGVTAWTRQELREEVAKHDPHVNASTEDDEQD